MKYVQYPFSEKKCSKIVLGGCSDALRKDKDGENVLTNMLNLGVNVWDAARGYGKCEEVIGKWFKHNPGKREEIFIISKGCLSGLFSRVNPKALKKDLDQSLRLLDTYIDLYLIHRDDKRCSLKEIFEILNDYKNKGLIRAYGVSNWSYDRIQQANEVCKKYGYAPIVASSVNFSYVPWSKDPFKGGEGCKSITNSKNEIDFYSKNQMVIFAYSPLARGFLSGKHASSDANFKNSLVSAAKVAFYNKENMARLEKLEKLAIRKNVSVPSLALAYIMNQDMLVYPISGTSKISSMKDNISALDIEFSKEELDYLKLTLQ